MVVSPFGVSKFFIVFKSKKDVIADVCSNVSWDINEP